MKFFLQDRGDPSVGLSGFNEIVEIKTEPEREFTEDEIELLCKFLPECLNPDASCCTETQYLAGIECERQAMNECGEEALGT